MKTVDEVKADVARAHEYAQTSEVQVVRQTMFNLQVCAPAKLTPDEVQAEANKINVSGTEGGWVLRPGEDPVVCANDQYRRHFLLDC